MYVKVEAMSADSFTHHSFVLIHKKFKAVPDIKSAGKEVLVDIGNSKNKNFGNWGRIFAKGCLVCTKFVQKFIP